MAINQFHIELIPKQSVIDKFGQLPTKLFIDHDNRKNHLDTNGFDAEFDFQDDLTINWWESIQSKFIDIEPYITSFLEPIEWSKNATDFKSYGDNNDNDLSIDLADKKYINEFSCRINIANIDKKFIAHILTLAKRLDCLITDKKGNLFEPTLENLAESIKKSNAFKFVSNSAEFFDKLSSGKIQME